MRWRSGKGNEPAWAAAEVSEPDGDYRRRRARSERAIDVARIAVGVLIVVGAGVIAWQLVAVLAS